MSVFTSVTSTELAPLLQRYPAGELLDLKGIAAGITNSNFFVTTSCGRYVLTLFETLTAAELPFYVGLMSHLAGRGIAVAAPLADHDGECIGTLNGKPTLIVDCLPGRVVETPNPPQCRAVGAMLARMHLAAADYPAQMANPRGPAWWSRTARIVDPFLDEITSALLHEEIALQKQHRFDHLPAGVIHADLFRDNVLMNGDEVGGFIDFYYACNDVLIYDLAIALNDWCAQPDGDIDAARARAMLAGYQSVRPLKADERADWPVLLRAAALRFWVSRLHDFHLPAAGELTWAKDPAWFERVIAHHRERKDFWL